MKNYLMGIDRGTTNIKVAVYDLAGNEIKVSIRTCEKVSSPGPGYAEQDMEQMWLDAAAAIRGIWDDRIRPEHIAAIGLSGQGGGLFLIDEKGKPVRKGIVSLDSRVAEISKTWKSEGGHEHFLKLWNGGNPTVPAALLYWLKICEPECYERIRWILQSKDWIRYRLTGEVRYDTTDASNGFLLDETLGYNSSYLESYGLDEVKDKFPDLLQPWEPAGAVAKDAAEACGLLEGVPVAAGGHDVAMAALGAGCYKKGQLTTVLGTWGLNLYVIKEPHSGMYKEAKIVLAGSRGCYLMINGGSTGSATEWFLRTFCQEELHEASEKDVDVFTVVENEVLTAPGAGRSDVVCHPFCEPPLSMAGYEKARFGFFDITGKNTKAQIIRAFYEGIAIEMAMSVEILQKAAGAPESMRLIGGGAASRLWGQMLADACRIKVEVMDIKEAGCRGAALNAGIAAGLYEDHSVVERLSDPVKKEYVPDREGMEYMNKKMERFKEVGQLLRGEAGIKKGEPNGRL